MSTKHFTKYESVRPVKGKKTPTFKFDSEEDINFNYPFMNSSVKTEDLDEDPDKVTEKQEFKEWLPEGVLQELTVDDNSDLEFTESPADEVIIPLQITSSDSSLPEQSYYELINKAVQRSKEGSYEHNGQRIPMDKSNRQCTYGPSTFYRELNLQGSFWNDNNPKTATFTNLTKKGFSKVWEGNFEDVKLQRHKFVLKPGDLMITYGIKNNGENSSHVAMWNGEHWVSDFVQNGPLVYSQERNGKSGNSVEVFRLDPSKILREEKGMKVEKEETKQKKSTEKVNTDPELLSRLRRQWPALNNIELSIIADPNFTKEATGVGSIEYISEPTITYKTGFVLSNPTNGPTIIYNPNDNTEEDILLDALHAMRDLDPTYQNLLKKYEDSQMQNWYDILYNSEYGNQLEKYSDKYLQSDSFKKEIQELPKEYWIQGIDGSLRSLFASDSIRSKSNYQPREEAFKSWLRTPEANNAFLAIKHYLETGTQPISKDEQGAKIIVIEKEVVKEPEEEKDPLKCLLCSIMNAMGHRHHAFSELRPDKLTDIFGGNAEIVIELGGPEKAYNEDSFIEMIKDILPAISTSKKYSKEDIKEIRSKKAEHGTSMKRLLALMDDDKILKAFHGMQLFKSGGELPVEEEEVKSFKTIDIEIADKTYSVREAITNEEKVQGLNNSKELSEDEGMIFYWDEPQQVSMTMKDCNIPLLICFFDEDQECISVQKGEPLSKEPIICENVKFVVELHPSAPVKVGDELDLPGDDDEYVMQVLGSDGSIQMQLKGGERIFSRPNTKMLLKWSKQAYNSDNPSDYKRLGKLIFKYLDQQDNRDPEYVQLDSKND